MQKLNYTLEKRNELLAKGDQLDNWNRHGPLDREAMNPNEEWSSEANQAIAHSCMQPIDPDDLIFISHDVVEFPFPMMDPDANKIMFELVDLPGHSGIAEAGANLNDLIIHNFLSNKTIPLHAFACVAQTPRDLTLEPLVKALLAAGRLDRHEISAHLVEIYNCRETAEKVKEERESRREKETSAQQKGHFKSQLEDWFRSHTAKSDAGKWSHVFAHCMSRGDRAVVLSNQLKSFVYSEVTSDETISLFRAMIEEIALQRQAELVDTHIPISRALNAEIGNKLTTKLKSPIIRSALKTRAKQFRTRVIASLAQLSADMRQLCRCDNMDDVLDRLDINEPLPLPSGNLDDKRKYMEIILKNIKNHLQNRFSDAVQNACTVAYDRFQKEMVRTQRRLPGSPYCRRKRGIKESDVSDPNDPEVQEYERASNPVNLLIGSLESKYREIAGNLDCLGPGLEFIRGDIDRFIMTNLQVPVRIAIDDPNTRHESIDILIRREISRSEVHLTKIATRCQEALLSVVDTDQLSADKEELAKLKKAVLELRKPSSLILPRRCAQVSPPAFTDKPAISRSVGSRSIPT